MTTTAPRIKLNKQPVPGHIEVKISAERIKAILKDLSEGSTHLHAAEANGIAYSTFYFWTKQGQLDIKYSIDSLEAYLVQALRRIEQEEIKKCRTGIVSSKNGHVGKQWTLEKVYWQHFGGSATAIQIKQEMELQKQLDNGSITVTEEPRILIEQQQGGEQDAASQGGEGKDEKGV